MGNLWSSAKSRDQWNVTEDELQARYFDTNDSKPTASELREYAGTQRSTRKAEAHCAYMIPTLIAMAREKADLRILDVGCGSGEITIDFAEMCPFAQVIGVDVSGAVLDSARVYAERRGVENVNFVQGSVYDMPEEWMGTFDVVHTHQAVAHFAARVRAVRELLRVARRGGGGIVCMREGDLRTARFYPKEYAELQECFGVIVDVHEANGGAADAGRCLRGWAIEAGVKEEEIVATQSVWRYDTPEGRKEYGSHWPGRCTQGVFAERAMELGVTSERLQEYAVAWRRWIDDENGIFAMLHGEVIARAT